MGTPRPTPGCTTADCGEDTATTPTGPSPTLMPPTLTPMSIPTTAFPTLTTARGLLMLSPLPMLRPIPGWLMAMAITPIATAMLDTEDTTATLMPTMARGLLMLSPPLMPTPRLTPG